jgi:hypothetical protein
LDQRDRDVLSFRRRAGKRAFAGALLLVGLFAPSGASANPNQALIYPTSLESAPGEYSPASASQDERAQKLAAELDETVREGVEDLGLAPLPPAALPPPSTDATLVTAPPESWVFAPRLAFTGDTVHVRLVAVAPGARLELVRAEDFSTATLRTLDVRTVVMLRDLVESARLPPRETPAERPRAHRFAPPAAPPSSGSAVLALHGAILGGYVGLTIEKASGSSDARLVYPLMALGAGLGLGASLLVADEWDITSGDAWFLTAGLWWPAASGFLLADGYGVKPDNRYLYGLFGAGAGLTLATAAIAFHPMSVGEAIIAHSGGAFGALLGAMTDSAVRGKTGGSLRRGLGYGSAAGVLLGGVLATQIELTPSRVLLIDLSASLGALGGAAIASPLLFAKDTGPTRTRLWLASAAAGTVAGGVFGWVVTSAPRATSAPPEPSAATLLPYASPAPSGRGMTVGVFGAF